MGHGLESVCCSARWDDAGGANRGPGDAALSTGVRLLKPPRASGLRTSFLLRLLCVLAFHSWRGFRGCALALSTAASVPPRGSGNFPPPGFLEARSQIKIAVQEIYPYCKMEKDHRFINPIFISSRSGGGADGCWRVQGADAWLASARAPRRVPALRGKFVSGPSLGMGMLGEFGLVKNFS